MTRSSYLVLAILFAAAPAFGQSPLADLTDADLANGKRLFEGQCARCHGMRGTGGEGANLARPILPHAADDSALFSVIRSGIPGSGMAGTRSMTDQEVWQVAGYVRSLGRIAVVSLPGDAERGKVIYETKGGCQACHIVHGQGGSLGPELTAVGTRRGSDYLRQALLDPGASLPDSLMLPPGYAEFLLVRVVTRDGREVRGMRVNEDAFTIQLRDQNDHFHSFRKPDLREMEKEFGKSLMPSYQGRLSTSEIDDLVAYLASLRGEP